MLRRQQHKSRIQEKLLDGSLRKLHSPAFKRLRRMGWALQKLRPFTQRSPFLASQVCCHFNPGLFYKSLLVICLCCLERSRLSSMESAPSVKDVRYGVWIKRSSNTRARVSNSLDKHSHFSLAVFCPSTSLCFFRLAHSQPLFGRDNRT